MRSVIQVAFLGLIAAAATFQALGCAPAREQNSSTTDISASQPVTVTDSATVDGHTLELRIIGERCVLVATSSAGAATQEHPLVPAPPCHFLRASGQPPARVRAYPDVGTEGVLIVSGTPVSDATRSLWKLPAGAVCGEQAQGVLLRGGHVLVTRAVRQGGVSCRDMGVDEKEYWTFAHDEK